MSSQILKLWKQISWIHKTSPFTGHKVFFSLFFRPNSIPPINQLLTCLRYYATGGHLSSIADFMGIAISSASRCVKKVSQVIASLVPQYVNMPRMEDAISTSSNFFQIASFPRVIGCIDGTHIQIQSPGWCIIILLVVRVRCIMLLFLFFSVGGIDGELFRNRKGRFSINTQIINDNSLKIRDIVSRWPGSTHDQTIFINSRIRARFENNEFPNMVLLGKIFKYIIDICIQKTTYV